MKKIKVKFCDFWNGFNSNDNFIVDILSQTFDVVQSDNPDYIFYSDFGYEHLKHKCIRIFYTGENIVPDFNIADYAIGFHHIDFNDRYIRYPLYLLYKNSIEMIVNRQKERFKSCEKPKFCNFIYSNPEGDQSREIIFNKLNAYKKVDSGGKYLNNIGYNVVNKYEFQKVCKFSIAFENSSTPGYSTEKILEAFAAETIPIYWGDPNIDTDFNGNAFINCHKYSSFDDAVERVIQIDNDDNLYKKILQENVFSKLDFIENKKIELSEFLNNIFIQDYEKAFRRNRVFRGKIYENNISALPYAIKFNNFFCRATNLLKRRG